MLPPGLADVAAGKGMMAESGGGVQWSAVMAALRVAGLELETRVPDAAQHAVMRHRAGTDDRRNLVD